MSTDSQDFHLFALLRPSDDQPGIWNADVPDIEVVMQGRSPTEALAAAWEASWLLISHDIEAGLNPLRFLERGEASDERNLIAQIMLRNPVEILQVSTLDDLQARISAIVVQLPLRLTRRHQEFQDETAKMGVWQCHQRPEPHVGA